MGKGNTVVQEEKTSLKMCILVPSTVVIMRICCCRELFLFDRRYTAKNYWPNKIYTQDIIGQDYWSRYHRSLVASRSWSHCVHGHIYCSHHRVLGHIYVVRQWNCYPPVTTCSSMVFVLGYIWNNGQHFIDRSHSAWLTSFAKDRWLSSSSSTSDAATPSSPTFIFVYDCIFNIYIHPSITTSTTVLL